MSENKDPGAKSAEVLRSMEEDSERLAHEIDEAREAVQAAHRADSMVPAGEEGFDPANTAPARPDEAVEPPVGGDADGNEPRKP